MAGTNPAAITLEHVLGLQADLMDGFCRPAFQQKLDELEEKHRGNERIFQAERQKLFLTVQKVVLPKWGFAGSPKGVFEMMKAVTQDKFNENPQVQRHGWRLNQLLRLGPVGPVPEAPPSAAGEHSAKRVELLKQAVGIIGGLESGEFRQAADALERRLGGQSEHLCRARELLLSLVFLDVLPKYGQEASDLGIAGFWNSLNALGENDEEVQKVRQQLLRLLERASSSPSAESSSPSAESQGDSKQGPCAGSWSGPNQPQAVFTLVQYGNGLVSANPREHWCPARGTINDKQLIVMDSPDVVKGYTGQLIGDVIMWQSGELWHRHVETKLSVRGGADEQSPEVWLEAPAGATVRWARGAVCGLDARLREEDLLLAAADGPDEPLQDEVVITPLLSRLRVCWRGDAGAA